MSPKIFITGITGTVGNALAHDLLKIGWSVSATVRDTESPAAKKFAAMGVDLHSGDWNSAGVLEKAMAGCDGLFLNLAPDFTDPMADREQGKRIIGIAKAAGVKHVVYSSAAAANALDRLRHFNPQALSAAFFQTKAILEQEIRDAGFPCYTILRPAAFMANWLSPKVGFMYGDLLETGIHRTALLPETDLAFVDEHDIAAFAIAAFQDPARFGGQEIELAERLQTLDVTLAQLSQAAGRPLRAEYMTEEEIEAAKGHDPMVEAHLMVRDMAQVIHMNEIKKWGIPLCSLPEYLEREKGRVQETWKTQ
ncbi:putative NAD dependent epimerase/dehydratase [Xylariaceae sp. FL0804]|nr:putative NAD dependent epimerase/dehydratase [Xylariaceae sp. FL0804]